MKISLATNFDDNLIDKSDWMCCMDALEDITEYAGQANIFYSSIIKNLKPYLAGTIKIVQKARAKTYLTDISAEILAENNKDYKDLTMDYCTPMGVLTNMESWLEKCKAITDEDTCFEVYNVLYNASIAYEKYINDNAIKNPTKYTFAEFIQSNDYFDKYYTN